MNPQDNGHLNLKPSHTNCKTNYKSVNDEQHYESSELQVPRILSPGRERTSTKS
jgi:hypothetical protein